MSSLICEYKIRLAIICDGTHFQQIVHVISFDYIEAKHMYCDGRQINRLSRFIVLPLHLQTQRVHVVELTTN